MRKAGFDPVEQSIDVAGGNEIRLAVALVPTVHLARLLVVSEAGATVILDRRVVGRGRFDGTVTPGLHEVQVTEPGKKAYVASTDLRDGDARSLQVTLEDDRRGVGIWPWLAGGALLAGGAVVGGYFLFRPHDQTGTVPPSTLPPVMVSGLPGLR